MIHSLLRALPARFLRLFLPVVAVVLAVSPLRAGVRETSGVLLKGTRWETPYYLQQSDRPGPTVVIVGGVHGDEPAGAAAAEQVRHWPILRGALAVLPRANPTALASHSRIMPEAAKGLGNLNRNFPKAERRGPAAGEPAQAIWAWVESQRPAWLVDLHEGSGFRAARAKSVGSSAIVCPSAETEAAVKLILEAVNRTIRNEKKRFVQIGPPVNGSLARAAGVHLGARAMILETTIRDLPPAVTKDSMPATKAQPQAKKPPGKPKEQPLSRRVRQHRLMVRALLVHLEMIEPSLDPDQLTGRQAAPAATWVALYDAGGTGGKGAACVQRILGAAGMRVTCVGPKEIAAGALPQFHLVVFPGGSASSEAAALGETGRRHVRRFVENGGGYLGICAGSYLATSGFDWGLKVLDAKTVSPRWQRGKGRVKIELTPTGKTLLGDRSGVLEVLYANGPVLMPARLDSLPDYESLAVYRSELAENGTPVGVMLGSPAIVAGGCGKGRVVCFSPHPEQTEGLEDFIRRAAAWVARTHASPKR